MEDLRQSIILNLNIQLLQREVKKAKCVVPVAAAATTAKIGPSAAINMFMTYVYLSI
jgi:hypothetical protein